MKFPRFTPFPGRYAFLRHLLPALVAGGICLSSCEDDMDRPSLSSHVSFTSEISSTWTPATRSTANAGTPQGTVSPLPAHALHRQHRFPLFGRLPGYGRPYPCHARKG